MGLTAKAATRRFYLDANTIIAMVERSHALTMTQRQFIAGIDEGRIVAMSSDIALAECLVGPLKRGDETAVASILEFLDDRPTLPLVPISREVMIKSAGIRASTSAKMLDAIHMACALAGGCDVFVSADKRLRVPKAMQRIEFDALALLKS